MLPLRHPDGHGRGYSNRTMVGNWWEDRLVANDSRMCNTTGERVLSLDQTQPEALLSTKTATDQAMAAARQTLPQPPPRPSMYPSEPALKAAVELYAPGGVPPAVPAFTIGRTTLQDPASPSAGQPRRDTTNTHFYHTLPAQQRAQHPEVYQHGDHSKYYKGTFRRELGATAHVTETEAHMPASKGSRGEMTRNPGESGNPWGVSVFVDEYATWGKQAGSAASLTKPSATK
ncbi:hypothetical protein V8C86DRAFT_2649193 [Haematococcus lacustris]